MLRRSVLLGMGAASGLSLAPPALAQNGTGRWIRLESQNFVAFSSADEQKSRQEVANLEAFDAVLSRLIPRSRRSAMKLNIYIAGRTADFKDAWGPHFDADAAGFYTRRIEEVRAVSLAAPPAPGAQQRQRDMPRNARAFDSRLILFHEYAHHYIMSNGRFAYPSWYNEGFAEFTSTVEFSDKGADLGKVAQERARWLAAGDWLDIERFLARDDLTPDERAMFYAQAWLAAHYLFERQDRAEGFEKYINALHDGGDAIGAFQPAFGITPAEFDKELQAYKKKGLRSWTLPGIKPDTANIAVTRLGASVDDIIMPLSYVRTLPGKEDAADAVARIREMAKKYPDDVYALRANALTEVWYGDLAEARKQLDALVARDASNAETQHLSGICDLRMARAAKDAAMFKRAQSAFGRAHRLDSTRAPSMYRYVESGLGALGTIDGHLLDVLVGAYQLAPHVQPIAETTAHALIQHRRFDEAVHVLRPLIANPHSEQGVARARDLLAAVKAGEPAVFTFSGAAEINY